MLLAGFWAGIWARLWVRVIVAVWLSLAVIVAVCMACAKQHRKLAPWLAGVFGASLLPNASTVSEPGRVSSRRATPGEFRGAFRGIPRLPYGPALRA